MVMLIFHLYHSAIFFSFYEVHVEQDLHSHHYLQSQLLLFINVIYTVPLLISCETITFSCLSRLLSSSSNIKMLICKCRDNFHYITYHQMECRCHEKIVFPIEWSLLLYLYVYMHKTSYNHYSLVTEARFNLYCRVSCQWHVVLLSTLLFNKGV